jgi:threonine synthase
VPSGKIAMGKLAQAVAHGARILQISGNFDDCLELARKTAAEYPVELVNSVNPVRIVGQQTAAWEICDTLGRAPDYHCLPVGNAGNITAYWKGYSVYADEGIVATRPKMYGFQAAGAAPLVRGEPVRDPDTIATAIRVGNPASWAGAVAARDASGGLIDAITDERLLEAYHLLASREGVFVEPASAISVAGVLATAADGRLPAGSLVVCTVTGHGLKDPDTALAEMPPVEPVPVEPGAVASALELA